MRRMDITEHQINGVEGSIAFSEFRGKGQRDNKDERKIRWNSIPMHIR